MPRCDKCRKKGLHIKCKFCDYEYCSSCIQLEKHSCTGIDQKCKEYREDLEKKLAFSPKGKVIKI